MSIIEERVRLAQRRLWLNRWLRAFGWSLAGACTIWLMGWILNRLFIAFPFPPLWTLLGAAGAGVAASVIWLCTTRDPRLVAAGALDEAAGLRERLSTSLTIKHDSLDPFEAAVVRDAEQHVAALSPRAFLPIRWPGSLSLGSLILVVAALSLLLPEFDLLNRKSAADQRQAQAEVNSRTQAVLARADSTMNRIAEKNHLEFDAVQNQPRGSVKMPLRADPEFRRRDALKKLDRMQSAIKDKMGDEKFDALKETKKRLRQLQQKSEDVNELSELISSMAESRFDESRKALKQVREKLAKMKSDAGAKPEEIRDMEKRLGDLARELQQSGEKAAPKQAEQRIRDLQNAGMTRDEAQRVLDELSKKDPEQLKKLARELAERLKKEGVTEEQMKKKLEALRKQMQTCEQSKGQCDKLGDKMSKAASQMKSGDLDGVDQSLEELGDELSQLEQMEQQLNDLDSQLAELEQLENDISNEQEDEQNQIGECKSCQGTGFRQDGAVCPSCHGSGRCSQGSGSSGTGGSRAGVGTGSAAHTADLDAETVSRKAKTRFSRGGGISGQRLIRDRQSVVPSTAAASDADSAEEIEDSDAVERERIPRVYRQSVKRFFDRQDETPAEAPSHDDQERPADTKP
ncbi:MAG: hypothetical protein KF841_08080 [Phycisphaerae bacterium]|nr:hypothetical protein [Phycisphaerae bacterium]